MLSKEAHRKENALLDGLSVENRNILSNNIIRNATESQPSAHKKEVTLDRTLNNIVSSQGSLL